MLLIFSIFLSFLTNYLCRLLQVFKTLSVPSGLSHYTFIESIIRRVHEIDANLDIKKQPNWKKAFVKADYMLSKIEMENEQLNFNNALNTLFKR